MTYPKVTYSTLINACAKARPSRVAEALELLTAMRAAGLTPGHIACVPRTAAGLCAIACISKAGLCGNACISKAGLGWIACINKVVLICRARPRIPHVLRGAQRLR